MDKSLLSIARLIGIALIIMGFLNILIAFNYELSMMPVVMFLGGIILFTYSSVEAWYKWVVIALVIAAGFLFAAVPQVGPYYKMILFYGTIVTALTFILSHRVMRRS